MSGAVELHKLIICCVYVNFSHPTIYPFLSDLVKWLNTSNKNNEKSLFIISE